MISISEAIKKKEEDAIDIKISPEGNRRKKLSLKNKTQLEIIVSCQ